MLRNTTKQQIFNAALELFAEKGYANTSLRDISMKVRIKTASVYYHYSSKEAILDDIFDFYEKRTSAHYQELINLDLNEVPVEDYPLKMHLEYSSEEKLPMVWAGRIVMNEHFWHPKAADLLLGSLFEQYIDCYEYFLNELAEKEICDGEKSRLYAEILVRVSMVFLMQFQHAEMFDAIEVSQQMDNIYKLFFELIIKNKLLV